MTSLLVTLRESGDALREAGQVKYQEMLDAATTDAVQRALDEFQLMDSHTLVGIANSYDFFSYGLPSAAYSTYNYPATGPFQNEFEVQWGFRRGQRTRAPSGEDAAGSYGYVFEVLIQVRSTGATGAGTTSVEQRSAIGVRIPGTFSYGQ
ncbi:MAG: hypothetical protein HY791_19835 [Deltaproteobacteria bacterium]|nr:hypothetical protein [Deltaproteobacteria bacterium]